MRVLPVLQEKTNTGLCVTYVPLREHLLALWLLIPAFTGKYISGGFSLCQENLSSPQLKENYFPCVMLSSHKNLQNDLEDTLKLHFLDIYVLKHFHARYENPFVHIGNQ